MIRIATKLLITMLALLFVAEYVPGIFVSGFYIALIVAVILGLINLTLKPILLILTLPINIITLGFFTFVINAFLFWFVATFIEGFTVEGVLPAFAGALIVSVFSWIGNRFI